MTGGWSVFVATGALSTTEFEFDAGAAIDTDGGVAVAENGGWMNPAADNATTPAIATETKPPIAVMQPGAVVQKEPLGSIFLSLMGISFSIC